MENLFVELFINWNSNPNIKFLGLTFHWYGILWGLNFIQGYFVLGYFLKKEQKPVMWTDYAFIAMLLGTILGARFGHVFFYNWSYYLAHPLNILKIWQGGMASHGAVIGIVLALWIYSKKVTKKSILWILDRLMIPIAIGSFLIRIGNLINQEIIGLPSKLPWAFIFSKIDNTPRHPSQLYEALSYLSIAIFLYIIYRKKQSFVSQGFFTGVFFTLAFLFRFLLEFFKENQVNFENNMTLNMGQLLSIPFFIFGVILLFYSLKNEKSGGLK